MGRIKTQLIKRISNEIVNEYKDKLKKTFDENKKIIVKLVEFQSKKIRNIVAGYVSRLMRKID